MQKSDKRSSGFLKQYEKRALYAVLLLLAGFSFLYLDNLKTETDALRLLPSGAPPGIEVAVRGGPIKATQQQIEQIGKPIEGDKVSTQGIQVYAGNKVISEQGWSELKTKLESSFGKENEKWFFSQVPSELTQDKLYRLFIVPNKKEDMSALLNLMKTQNIPHFPRPRNLRIAYLLFTEAEAKAKEAEAAKDKTEEPAKTPEQITGDGRYKSVKVHPPFRHISRYYDLYTLNEENEVVTLKKGYAMWTWVVAMVVTYPDGSQETIIAESNVPARRFAWSDFSELRAIEGDVSPITARKDFPDETILFFDFPVPPRQEILTREEAEADYLRVQSAAWWFLSDNIKTAKGFTYTDWYNEVIKAGIKIRMPSPEYLKFLRDLKEAIPEP